MAFPIVISLFLLFYLVSKRKASASSRVFFDLRSTSILIAVDPIVAFCPSIPKIVLLLQVFMSSLLCNASWCLSFHPVRPRFVMINLIAKFRHFFFFFFLQWLSISIAPVPSIGLIGNRPSEPYGGYVCLCIQQKFILQSPEWLIICD